MKRLQAYKFQLMATPTQERKMARFAGCRRFVYNEALALQERRFESGESRLGYAALCRELTKWRHLKEKSFLAEAPTHPLQQALKDLERAYGNFFGGRGGLPKFHRRGRQDGFRYPDPKQIKHDEVNGRIFLPKLGWMRYRKSREIAGAIKQVTVSRKCGRWYVSIQTERELIGKERVNDSMVGIDMGVARFATLSDGTVYEPENHYRRNEKRLAKAQRQMSRKRKFGANCSSSLMSPFYSAVQGNLEELLETHLILLEMSSDEGIGHHFGEGVYQFWITPDDLKNRRFDKVELTTDAY